MIDVALVGTGGMMPLPGRWLSSLLLRVNSELVLFDCGEGTQIAMRQLGRGFRRLSTIGISHAHADHIAGLPGLLHAVANAGRTEPMALFGPPGISPVVASLRVIAPYLPFELLVHECGYDVAVPLSGGVTLRSAPGVHALPVLAFRIDLPRGRRFLAENAIALGVPQYQWRRLQAGEHVHVAGRDITADDVLGPPRRGVSVAYVTDTRPTRDILHLVAGADLLVCEGTYGRDDDRAKAEERGHMTFREAATLAKEARVERLWLTHFSPAVDVPEMFLINATSIFPDTTIGSDGLTASLKFQDD